LDVEIWLAPTVSSAGAGLTITLSHPHNGEYANAICAEYNAALTLDVKAGATGTIPSAGGASTTGTITTTQATEVLVGAVDANEFSESTGPSTNGFTPIDNTNGKTSTGYLEKIVSATTTTSSGTSYNAFGEYAGAIAGFKTTVSTVCNITITSSTTLTANMVCSTSYGIIVGANGITLNCAGYSITGTGTGIGIYLFSVTGVTVENCAVNDWTQGILLLSSSNNFLISNSASGDLNGFIIQSSSNNNFVNGNAASSDSDYGFIVISSSNGNNLAGNVASNDVQGGFIIQSSSNILTGNSATNDPGTSITGGFTLYSGSNNNILTDNVATSDANGGFVLESSNNNLLGSNVAKNSGLDSGFYVDSASTGNTFVLNAANSNAGYGYHDFTTGGPSGSPQFTTLNFYLENTDNGLNGLGPSSPSGLG
jgi:parallel beta-helix repeat protein